MKEYQSTLAFEMGLQISCGVFIPKKYKKLIVGAVHKHLVETLRELAEQKECQIVEGHLMLDHVHICISSSPKHSVS